jgi:hypothetical protein
VGEVDRVRPEAAQVGGILVDQHHPSRAAADHGASELDVIAGGKRSRAARSPGGPQRMAGCSSSSVTVGAAVVADPCCLDPSAHAAAAGRPRPGPRAGRVQGGTGSRGSGAAHALGSRHRSVPSWLALPHPGSQHSTASSRASMQADAGDRRRPGRTPEEAPQIATGRRAEIDEFRSGRATRAVRGVSWQGARRDAWLHRRPARLGPAR